MNIRVHQFIRVELAIYTQEPHKLDSFLSVRIATCGDPQPIENAVIVGDSGSNTVGSQMFYQCNPNYIISSGDGLTICEQSESGLAWTGGTLVCEAQKIATLVRDHHRHVMTMAMTQGGI